MFFPSMKIKPFYIWLNIQEILRYQPYGIITIPVEIKVRCECSASWKHGCNSIKSNIAAEGNNPPSQWGMCLNLHAQEFSRRYGGKNPTLLTFVCNACKVCHVRTWIVLVLLSIYVLPLPWGSRVAAKICSIFWSVFLSMAQYEPVSWSKSIYHTSLFLRSTLLSVHKRYLCCPGSVHKMGYFPSSWQPVRRKRNFSILMPLKFVVGLE